METDGTGGSSEGSGNEGPRVRLPLNSKRLKRSQLERLAKALDLPTSASGDELRQLIDGKLTDQGKEARNVQVVSDDATPASRFALEDEEGEFLEVPADSGGGSAGDSQPTAEPDGGGTSRGSQESEVASLTAALEEARRQAESLQTEVSELRHQLTEEKTRFREMWRSNCRCLAEYDSVIAEKDVEIEELKHSLQEATSLSGHDPVEALEVPRHRPSGITPAEHRGRRGKAPPVDPFTGKSPEMRFDDWLPSLERASQWNEWSEEELLMQLAGHMRGRALQEWSLIGAESKKSYKVATASLRTRLDPGSRTLAAQDFRHTVQREDEPVPDFIRRLERAFNIAYGRDGMTGETRDTLLYGQLQEGLKYDIMKSPAVSGAQKYSELCVSARNEERRLAELRKRQQYVRNNSTPSSTRPKEPSNPVAADSPSQGGGRPDSRQADSKKSGRKCFICKKPGHLAHDCRLRRAESGSSHKPFVTKQVQTTESVKGEKAGDTPTLGTDLLSCLLPDSNKDDHICQVRIDDRGSRQQYVDVLVGGVPARGVIDSGADITIMGGDLFRRVAAAAQLRRSSLKKPDRVPRTYDRKTFSLDGCVDLDVTFDGTTMKTPIYVKADAPEQLLLAEGVCRQLKIIMYHPNVLGPKGGKVVNNGPLVETADQTTGATSMGTSTTLKEGKQGDGRVVATPPAQKVRATTEDRVTQTNIKEAGTHAEPTGDADQMVPMDQEQATTCPGELESDDALVPTVRVWLQQSIRLLPQEGTVVTVRVEPVLPGQSQVLVECAPATLSRMGLSMPDALLEPTSDGYAQLLVTNPSGFTQTVEQDALLGEATTVEVVQPDDHEAFILTTGVGHDLDDAAGHACSQVRDSHDGTRRKKLLEKLGEPELPDMEKKRLLEFLTDQHEAFSLEEGERGETSLVEMEIDTGDTTPRRQPPRRMPYSVRQEIARQLSKMQKNGVIQPSKSPWASPVVLVRKRDGTHRFCVDYRGLNTVTKADTFPLPRISDLLDQLGRTKYFSTIDLASGFWQIRMHPSAQEKTAFVTPQGLFEFRVMPFGLRNAPAVFQRLMQQVVSSLNPESGPDYVSVYLDDILVFSRSLEDHLEHLQRVISRLKDVGLKLNPAKCYFVRSELEYLGHLVTRNGLKTSPRLVEAVQEFPTPTNIQDVRRFLGLSSYYRRFIQNFARIARPLHQLTCKGAPFAWSQECQTAFLDLKSKLTTAPVLAYPRFDRDFTLETDASIQGLGAVLSQVQDDSRLHPVAYASRALSESEKNYSVTELETLAVVWALSHYHHYLYGNSVTVQTDHAAVKAVLETPNPTGKHARWWTRVYGRGVKEVRIVYRAGKENVAADALSRRPQGPAPPEGITEAEIQVSTVSTSQSVPPPAPLGDTTSLAKKSASVQSLMLDSFDKEQRKDPCLSEMVVFLEHGALPADEVKARKIANQAPLFAIIEGILYYVDAKQGNAKRAVVPRHLRKQILEEGHAGPFGGHFSGKRLYSALALHWWWEGMYTETVQHCKACPECATATGTGRAQKPPLCPIPVRRPFQIWGLDIMDLPKTEQGNKHVIVFQDLFTKWPMVYPAPDQRAHCIARLLAEEIVPLFGVPECLLTDRGANLLSNLMSDVCRMLGTRKLNTTAYHPQCDATIERFNRTLKGMLRKHAARFGPQWDRYLPGVLWAYRNTPHSATGEKPSFLLFGIDCRSPTQAAFLQVTDEPPVDVEDYREELMHCLSSARDLALKNIEKAQRRYKQQYDKKATEPSYRVGEWVLVKFPHEETGKGRKLSRPWHGPYRIVDRSDPDLTVTKVYSPQEGAIKVHQSRVCLCPTQFPPGYYWYGGKRKGPGRPPKWVDRLLAGQLTRGQDQSTEQQRELPTVEEGAREPEPSCVTENEGHSDEPHAQAAEGEPDVGCEAQAPASRRADQTPMATRSQSRLRRNVQPPDRFMSASSRSSLPCRRE